MVNGYDGCWDEEALQIGGQGGVDSRQYGYEMIVEGTDGALSKVRTVISRWQELRFMLWSLKR